MPSVLYAATRYGYCVQVIDGGQIVDEYSAGNCWQESSSVIDPSCPHAVPVPQLKHWAKQTAREIARERKIPAKQIAYDPDLETEAA
jgi:hypothetical protein